MYINDVISRTAAALNYLFADNDVINHYLHTCIYIYASMLSSGVIEYAFLNVTRVLGF